MTTIEAKLRTAAAAFPALTVYIGTSPMRWYDTQLDQGSEYPAVTVRQISNPKMYSYSARMGLSQYRIQFTVWDTDAERGRSVQAEIEAMLDTFNAIGQPGLSQYPCRVVNALGGMYPQSEPPVFQRIVDAMIWNNDSL